MLPQCILLLFMLAMVFGKGTPCNYFLIHITDTPCDDDKEYERGGHTYIHVHTQFHAHGLINTNCHVSIYTCMGGLSGAISS